ncbi:MAG: hypothetical protein H7123_07025 [Thermoleophilia bacterium]|nr:hypothetical protein [Thermoleophilia bacterium]
MSYHSRATVTALEDPLKFAPCNPLEFATFGQLGFSTFDQLEFALDAQLALAVTRRGNHRVVELPFG